MGLKQMVSRALIDKAMQGDTESIAALPPVRISGDAQRAYAALLRRWTGWNDITLTFGEPPAEVSPFAVLDRGTHVVTANPERLLLNPHRVLTKVNPFRLRQEAVLTGALMHEAAHARHTHWMPRNEIDAADFKHPDGSAVTKAEFALAKTVEEARIEGIMAAEADSSGAVGLAWTMRASAAYLIPMTDLSADPDQAIMDLISSWTLRAGRQIALQHHLGHQPPAWVGSFTTLLHETFIEHLAAQSGVNDAMTTARSIEVLELLFSMCRGTDTMNTHMFKADSAAESDTGTFMVERAKKIITLLFPETPPDQVPSPSSGCTGGESNDPAPSQGVTDLPDDESGEAGAGEPAEGEGEESPGEAESGAESGAEEAGTDTESALAKAVKAIEAQAKSGEQAECKTQSKAPPPEADRNGGVEGGAGAGGGIGGGWRKPDLDERDVQKNAERFLRDLIEPNVASKIKVTDQPSSMIDGAALSAWKAGGQVKEPRFFQQVKRTVKPSPPVKIAVLVDVSSSMGQLQKPSALLSWALASACLDLRNFAGGGVMIESTLIHWGDDAEVIQRNGQVLPGIREVRCEQGTSAMHEAYTLIEQEIPDFFEVKENPENKLIVQFTDWHLSSRGLAETSEWVGRGLEAGATLLSVVPAGWNARSTALPRILSENPIQRGRNVTMRYDKSKPEGVWHTAAEVLSA